MNPYSFRIPTAPPCNKYVYVESPSVKYMAEQDAHLYRSLRGIRVEGRDVPNRIRSFEEANFPDHIINAVKSLGLIEPTPIQAQAWSVALKGRDLIGIAKSGSGKTLAYLLPALVHIMAHSLLGSPGNNQGPTVLVLAPTAELASQIHQEASKLTYGSNIRSACFSGGVSMEQQFQTLQTGLDIVIATPDRLHELLVTYNLNLHGVTYLVLDKTDHISNWFQLEMEQIMSKIRPDRQTLCWSTKYPKGVEESMVSQVLQDPCKVVAEDYSYR